MLKTFYNHNSVQLLRLILITNITTPLSISSKSLGCKTGVVSTGNSLDHTEMDDTLMLANGAYSFQEQFMNFPIWL